MRQISIISKLTGVTNNVESAEVTLNSSSIIELKAERADIASIVRSNQDMIITLHSGETITVKNFYAYTENGGSQLVLEESNGALWWVQDTEGGFHFEHIANIDELLAASGTDTEGGAIWPWVLGGVVAAAGIGIAAGSGGGGGGGGDSDSDGNGSTGGDNAGAPGTSNPGTDDTPPAAPTNLNVSTDGKTFTGRAEAGSTVTISDGNGNIIGKGTAGSDGHFTIPLTKPQISGEDLTAHATDPAGNESPDASVTAPNIPLPEAPALTRIVDDFSPVTGTITNNHATNDNTPTLQGKGVAGSIVHIYDGEIEIGTATVIANGTWSYTPSKALSEGTHTFSVTTTNAKGESSHSAVYSVIVDTVKPDAPENLDISADGKTVTGTAEADSIVTIIDSDGNVLGSTTAGTDGKFTVTLTMPKLNGEILGVAATDAAGNISVFTPVVAADHIAPTAPVITSVIDDIPQGTGAIKNGQTTNDALPTLNGTAEPNATITVYVDGNAQPVITADGEGNWTWQATTPLDEGSHNITVTASDKAGNVSPPSTEFIVEVDSTASAAPTIASAGDNVGAVQNAINSGGLTDDNTPSFTGSGVNGDTITLYNGATVVGTAMVVGGVWTITPATPLPNGALTLTATATDPAGNVSSPSNNFTLTVDTSVPTQPATPTIVDDQTPGLGTVAEGATTNDTTPTISGTGTAGDTITVYDNGTTVLGTTTVRADGSWSVTPTTPLAESAHSVTVVATDPAGNASLASAAAGFTVDTTPLAAPVVTAIVDDDIVSAPVPLSDGSATNDTTPTLSGTGTPGSTISIFDNGSETPLGTVVVGEDGRWSYTTPVLDDGDHDLTFSATNPAGNTATAADSVTLTIDTDAPDAPVVSAPLEVTGTVITGNAEAGSTVIIRGPDGTEIGRGIANPDGAFTVTVSPAQNNAEALTAIAEDPAGNQSEPVSFTATDSDLPGSPVITEVVDDVPTGTSDITSGQTTNDVLPTLNGTAEPDATITVYVDGNAQPVITADGEGNWTWQATMPLDEGSHTFTATQTTSNGISGSTPGYTIIVDTLEPAIPTITSVVDDITPNIGSLDTGQRTNDPRPDLNGSGEVGSTITILNNGDPIGTARVNTSGTWSFTPADNLPEGSNTLTVIATDAAGNVSAASEAFNVIVDTVAPAVPVVTEAIDDNGSGQVPVISGQSTNDTTPTLNGTAEANATITVRDGATILGTTTADGAGNWSFTPPAALGQGNHTLTVVATDTAGNNSNPSGSFAIVVDSLAPATPVIVTVTDNTTPTTGAITSGVATNETRPALTGTGEVGATITVYNDGTAIGTTTVGAAGNWSFTPTTPVASGSHNLTVTATDTAGNISLPSAGFTLLVDTAAPVVPVLTSVADDIGAVTGNLANGQITDDARPALTGTAEANATVNIYDNGSLLGSTQANESGAWTFTPDTALANGSHTLTITATDVAGNISPATTPFTIVVDTLAPTSPIVIQAYDDVGSNLGNLVSGQTTNDNQPLLSGTAEANSTVNLYDNGAFLGITTATATGTWSFTPATALNNATHVFTATSTDSAGNIGAISGNFTLIVDTIAPTPPVLVTVIDDVAGGVFNATLIDGQRTNDARPTLNGTAEAGTTVNIYDNGTLLSSVVANSSGSWSYTPTGALAQGNHAFTITATDLAGNTSTATLPTAIIVDTTPPAEPTAIISADGATVSGIAEANSTVTITLPGGGTFTATADASGNYTATLPVRQIEGQQLSVNATDVAGNISISVNVVAPTLPLSADNNVVDLALTSDSTITSEHYSDYGLLLVGALGETASVLGDDAAQVGFTIEEGGSGSLIIDAAATGVVLSLLNTLEIAIQKYDSETGTWSTIIDSSAPQFANLLTLGASGVTMNVTGLEGGTYRVLSYNTSLLATGSLTSLDVSVIKASAGTLTGTTTHPGNVITDSDPNGGQDNAPAGTVVTSVTNAQGVVTTVPVGSDGIDIQGQYGVLHIRQDGSYTYTLTSTSPSILGHTDNFTYTITHNGVSDSAQLVVTLGNGLPASSVTATDNTAALTYSTDVEAIDHGASSQSGFSVVGIGLGNVLSLDVLANMTDPIIFDVDDGSTRTMTLQASVGGVALLSTFDLYIYKFNDITQQFEQYKVEKSWLTAPLLGGQSAQLTLTLPGGEYLFLLNNASGITVLTGYTLNILQDHTYAVESNSANANGNILQDDIAPADSHITQVNGLSVASSGTTNIEGQYGTLTIDAQGNYTYHLNAGVGADSIKTPDSFVYTVTAPNGDTSTASLNITATPQAVNAVDDSSTMMAVSTAQDTAAYSDTDVGSAVWDAALLSSTSQSGSGAFVVDANTVLHNPVLHFNVASLLTLGGLNVNWTLIGPSGVVKTDSFSGGLLLGGVANIDLSGLDLQAGTYTLSYTGSMGPLGLGQIAITPTVTGTTIDLDSYSTLNGSTVHGNLYDGTDAAGIADQVSSVHTLMTITGFNGSSATLNPLTDSSASATIQGQYGTLKMGLDGAYTYTLNSGVSPATLTIKETFNYSLNDQNGHTDSATLTINMNPQFVSTAQSDVINGSVYGDTLIYDLLNTNSATGGNGADSWKNFSLAQGDKIDIHDLLQGWNGEQSTLGNYLHVTTNGNNTVIAIDRDGTGTAYNSTTLVTLENVHTTLDELVQQNHIVT